MSNFAFLRTELPDLFNAVAKAESVAHPDPRTARPTAHRAHLAELDALFATHQHLAFRGEL